MGKIKRAKTPDGPREQSPVAKAAAVSALRETLRISEAANASERRESARRLSQQAHRFATSEDGLGIERVQIEADVRVRRVLNALRDKDDQLATAHRRIEDLENQLDLSREECAKLKERCLGLEDSLQAKKQELSHSEAVSTQRKMEGARIKGLLADCRFDLDLLGSKYERLLDERATIGLSRELVDAARRRIPGFSVGPVSLPCTPDQGLAHASCPPTGVRPRGAAVKNEWPTASTFCSPARASGNIPLTRTPPAWTNNR